MNKICNHSLIKISDVLIYCYCFEWTHHAVDWSFCCK